MKYTLNGIEVKLEEIPKTAVLVDRETEVFPEFRIKEITEHYVSSGNKDEED